MNEKQNEYLFKNEYYFDNSLKLFIYKTDIRLEKLNNLNELQNIKKDKNLIIFTHEWLFPEQKSKLEQICAWAIENEYSFQFPEIKTINKGRNR